MHRPHQLLIAAMGMVLLGQEVHAACTDAAAPGVQWRRCIFDSDDLSNTDLTGADLRDSGFKRTDLTGADLTRVQARRAKFVSGTLRNVNLTDADLVQADFTSADLSGAKLIGASLRGARLFQANLRGADLTRAVLDGADLLRTDFSGARWTDGTTICAEGSLDRCRPKADAPATKVQG